MTPPLKIIGGMFGLDSPSEFGRAELGVLPEFLSGRQIKLATARGAFTLLGSYLKPNTVWLPSYLCGVIIEAFPKNLIQIRFYTISDELKIAEDTWLSEVQEGDMVVFIDYFGFSSWSEWGAEVRRRGAWVVEDACQALLNDQFSIHADYVIFSPRKFVGVPDGGILKAQGDAKLPVKELPLPPAAWWLDAFAAVQLRAEFDRHGSDRRWFELFRKCESCAPLEPVRMSELSCCFLFKCFDYKAISEIRRANYSLLANLLDELALFPQLPPGIVPIGFPVRLKDREKIREVLFDQEIYPAVHWSIAGSVPVEFTGSHRLAAQIMTLPCDQRYNFDDISRMVNLLIEGTAN